MNFDVKSIPRNAKKTILRKRIYSNRKNPLCLLTIFSKKAVNFSTRDVRYTDNFAKGGYVI